MILLDNTITYKMHIGYMLPTGEWCHVLLEQVSIRTQARAALHIKSRLNIIDGI